jgi:5'-3' exonuclease
LREIIHFGFSGESSKNTLKTVMKFTKESDFQLLHLSLLREYLQIEFCQGLAVDLESTIDDFVFMTFLVGNDFLPHLNSLDIGDGAFDLLFETYKSQRARWGQGNYLTHAGEIPDPARLEAFLAVIGALEGEILEQKEQDEALYMKKRRKWDKRDGKAEGPSEAELEALEVEKEEHYLAMIEGMMKTHSLEGHFVDKKKPMPTPGEKDYKGRYYFEKLHLTPVNISEHMALRKAYIEGLLWCLAYYYRGCISWGWYYPYHYGTFS